MTTSMIVTVALILDTACIATASPREVRACLARHPDFALDVSQKPPYLRLFLTSAATLDYVVAVREHASGPSRALVCRARGGDILLGAKFATTRFSDMPDDDYMSSRWRVCHRKDVLELSHYYPDLPKPINDTICLQWEDGGALIYFDGQDVRWKGYSP